MRRTEVEDVYSDWLEHARLEHPRDYKKYKRFLKRYG